MVLPNRRLLYLLPPMISPLTAYLVLVRARMGLQMAARVHRVQPTEYATVAA